MVVVSGKRSGEAGWMAEAWQVLCDQLSLFVFCIVHFVWQFLWNQLSLFTFYIFHFSFCIVHFIFCVTSSVKPAFTFYFLPRGKLNCISRVTESDHLYISWVNINQTIFEPPEFYQKFWHRCNFRHFSSNPIHKPSWIRTYLTNYMSELSKLFSVRAMYLRRICWKAKTKTKPAMWVPIMQVSLPRSKKLPTGATFVTSLVVPPRT